MKQTWFGEVLYGLKSLAKEPSRNYLLDVIWNLKKALIFGE